MTRSRSTVRVVLFSGGRGSGPLTRPLVSRPGLSLTIAINGYDDGASTGEVRRFLGDSLGPSDFRKNASRVARQLGTCAPALLDAFDARLPGDIHAEAAVAELERLAHALDGAPQAGEWIGVFLDEYRRRPCFHFGDCSVGNIVFAGAFLAHGRAFNAALDAYCSALGLPAGAIDNVTDGANAHLVALDAGGRLLRTEDAIVDARRHDRIREIFLVSRPPDDGMAETLEALGAEEASKALRAMEPRIALNPRVAAAIEQADIIIYAPGTQHSSLFPSYMTTGFAEAIAGNLGAIKLLITNIEQDAEIAGSTAMDLIERALFYMRRGSSVPSPCLITHYLLNEPGKKEDAPYVQLGPIELMEDPRLVRIGAYEEGVTGQHDAARVLEPFLDGVTGSAAPRAAVLLHDAGSLDKVTETILEMVRGDAAGQPVDITVFCLGDFSFSEAFRARLPFPVRSVGDTAAFLAEVAAERFDYVALFESSGMYRGEDLVALLSHLSVGHLDAVWGSRRLSVRDMHESYRVRYVGNRVVGAISFVGSHLLSLACLVLYGRYISDTLSAVRAIRAADALATPIDLTRKRANQFILSRLLRRRADVLELPVRFTPISPTRVHRTSFVEGLQALITLIMMSM